jgi:hypothetical protein
LRLVFINDGNTNHINNPSNTFIKAPIIYAI